MIQHPKCFSCRKFHCSKILNGKERIPYLYYCSLHSKPEGIPDKRISYGFLEYTDDYKIYPHGIKEMYPDQKDCPEFQVKKGHEEIVDDRLISTYIPG